MPALVIVVTGLLQANSSDFAVATSTFEGGPTADAVSTALTAQVWLAVGLAAIVLGTAALAFVDGYQHGHVATLLYQRLHDRNCQREADRRHFEADYG